MPEKLSKTALAKRAQGYRQVGPNCGNCIAFTSEMSPTTWGGHQETNKRCVIGGFATGRSRYCDRHKWKSAE